MIRREGTFILAHELRNMTINGDRYINVLEDHLLPCFYILRYITLMHSSAPGHNGKKMSKWFASLNITVLKWLGNNPDLSPLENAWSNMNTRSADYYTSYRYSRPSNLTSRCRWRVSTSSTLRSWVRAGHNFYKIWPRSRGIWWSTRISTKVPKTVVCKFYC